MIARLKKCKDTAAQHAEGIKIALETIAALKGDKRIAGFELSSDHDHDAILAVAGRSGLGATVHA
jgi:hypothetical protein